MGGGLPVGALAAVVIVLVITRRRYRHPLSTTGGESTSGIATLSDAEVEVMNNCRSALSPTPTSMTVAGKGKSKAAGATAAAAAASDCATSGGLVKDAGVGASNELTPGRCAKVSNVDRQRALETAPEVDAQVRSGLPLQFSILCCK